MGSPIDQAALRREILALAESRGAEKTFCPSDVARRLSEDWRPLMGDLRDAARELAREGRVRVSQKGHTLSPDSPWQGAIRLQQVDSHER